MKNKFKGLWRSGVLKSVLFKSLMSVLCAIGGVYLFYNVNRSPQMFLFGGLSLFVIAILFAASARGMVATFGTIPYWGQLFGKDTLVTLFENEEFEPYKTDSGFSTDKVKISKSGKWLQIGEEFYPKPLIRGMTRSWRSKVKDQMVMINGATVTNPLFAKGEIGWVLDDMFEPLMPEIEGYDSESIFEGNKEAFQEAWKGSFDKLARADWMEVRYKWEQAHAEYISIKYRGSKKSVRRKKTINENNVYKLMFGRVLSGDEIDYVRNAVDKKRIRQVERFYQIESYRTQLCVCNGIGLLASMGYPANQAGKDFLFDCIKDIQKPYCNDAVEVLKHFPENELKKRIDADMVKAHEANDLLWAAGLMCLAKAIGYKATLPQLKGEARKFVAVQPAGGGMAMQALSEAEDIKGFELKG